MAKAVFKGLCPNCGGPICSERLEKALPCSRCLPTPPQELPEDRGKLVKTIGARLLEEGRLSAYWGMLEVEEELDKFSEFFMKATGYKLWSAQKTWVRRLLMDESFAIIAPTGVGKSTILAVYALYKASKGSRILLLVPTENLARQSVARLRELAENAGVSPSIAYFYSSLRPREKAGNLALIESGKYDILVATASFLSRRFNMLEGLGFDLVEVDDVDSLLKSSKNIDRVLLLLGFTEKIIGSANDLVLAKINAMRSRLAGDKERYEKLAEKIRSLEADIAGFIASNNVGQLVIASATGRAGGIKAKVFRELLGFEAGGIHEYLRRIDTFYTRMSNPLRDVERIVEELGAGGLIFVARDLGRGIVKQLVEYLRKRGIKAAAALAGRRFLEKFAEGKYDVLVGTATYYGVIVRGIDQPERVRYTVFVGVPRFRIPLDSSLRNPVRLLQFLLYFSEKGDEKAKQYFSRLSKIVEKLSYNELLVLRISLMNNESLTGFLENTRILVDEAARHVAGILEEELKPGDTLIVGNMMVKRGDRGFNVLIPDAMTFIQASGRASRMYKGKMTYGLAVILYEDKEILRLLENRLKYYMDKVVFKPYRELDIPRAKEMMEESRRGEGDGVKVKSVLFVVESPTKARTIAGFFGRPSKRRLAGITIYEIPFTDADSGLTYLLTITATRGHIFDLVVDEGMHGVKKINGNYIPVYATIKRCRRCGYQFTGNEERCPRCGSLSIQDQRTVVDVLRRLALEVDEVLIGTDPDTEGEKIAWDVMLAVKPYNTRIHRVEFHEVTRRAILEALRNPRNLNTNLVEAQMLRRILDRWIGFELSRLLWKVYRRNWLGAGRVQTPVLGWIIDRYGEWKEGRGFIVAAKMPGGGAVKIFVEARDEAEKIAGMLSEHGLRIIESEKTAKEIPPPPPFTTDSLLFEASVRLGFTASKAMRIAQELFESGLITYHRTDSVYVSPVGREIARSYLEGKGLGELFAPRSWGKEGAHESIRPTRPVDASELRRLILDGSIKVSAKMTESHYKLYDLVFRRFIASQMKGALVRHARIILSAGDRRVEVEGYDEVLRQGFTALWPPKTSPWMREAAPGAVIKPQEIRVYRGSKTRLYLHGDIIRLMRDRGIGRPSTYAKILSSLRRHGYIIESAKRKYVVPTKMGIKVHAYLREAAPGLVSEDTTRLLEERMRLVEQGREKLYNMLIEAESMVRGVVEAALATMPGSGEGSEAKAENT